MPWVDDGNASLLTDLYEITMAAAYLEDGIADTEATFELTVRSLPEHRNFLVAAGLDDALRFLEEYRFEEDALDYLRRLGRFRPGFLEHLAGMRFEGEVWAVPEGTVVFGREPLLRVTAPIVQAQVMETFLLNAVGFQTMIAAKAARVRLAAGDTSFTDFGARRSHGADAGLKGARAAYLGGADSTSVVLAGKEYGIPVTGTMAHSYVLSHASERDAFLSFGRAFPNDTVLLVDTFDTVEGTRIAAEAARTLREEGIEVQGIRLDSGDLGDLARRCRAVLDEAGLPGVAILASGGLDEYRVADLLGGGAPIDGFGVGTSMTTSNDAPSLDVVYKLVADATGPRMKTSTGKLTLPGVKQVWRSEREGRLAGDVIALADEDGHPGVPLLEPVMREGRRTRPAEEAAACRERTLASLERLPEALRSIREPAPAPVRISGALDDLVRTLGGRRA